MTAWQTVLTRPIACRPPSLPHQKPWWSARRKTWWLPLDDLLVITREFIPEAASRSALSRWLRRHGMSRLPVETPAGTPHQTVKTYEPGYLHLDVKYLPQLADETTRRYRFVAIDRATRWVYIAIKPNKTAASARAFLNARHQAGPIKITQLLTDHGQEFTDRLFGSKDRPPTGDHGFDPWCEALGMEPRLTQPRTPPTNGMVERFKGRIAQVLATRRYHSAQDLEATLLRSAWLYHHH